MKACSLGLDCGRGNHLAIIGAGVEQRRAYDLARRRGLCIVGSDRDRHAPSMGLADHRVIASTRSPIETVDALRRSGLPLSGVMTIANDVPKTVAAVAAEFGLPGLCLRSARMVADKLAMKEAFLAGGVRTPWFTPIASVQELDALRRTRGPLIAKPIDGRGARGVVRLLPEVDSSWAFDFVIEQSDASVIIVEDFIEGRQLSTESFLSGGVVNTAGISERNYEFLDRFAPHVIENGGDLPACLDGATRCAVDELVGSAASAVAIDDGIVKGDIILTSSGPVVVEIAARLSGGYFASHQIPAATGIDLVDVAISHALGEPVESGDLVASRSRASSIRYWFPRSGRVADICGVDSLPAMPGVVHCGIYIQPGDTIVETRHHAGRSGFVVTEGRDIGQSRERATAAIARLSVSYG